MGCGSSKANPGGIPDALGDELFIKFLEMKREVDDSMTSLAKALHSTMATMRLLSQDSKNETAANNWDGEILTHRKNMQLERSCFFHLENLIQHEERTAIKNVCKLLNFITKAAEDHLMIKESDEILELERYSTVSKAKVWDQASEFDIMMQKLEADIEDFKHNNELLTKRNETLINIEMETKEEKKQIQIQMEVLENDLESKIKKLSRYETKAKDFENNLKQDREGLKKQLDQERDEKESLHMKISELENIREKFESEKHEKHEKIEQVKIYEREVDRLHGTHDELKKRISILEKEEQNHKKQNALLESDNQRCDSERRELKRNVEQLQKNLQEKETDIRNINEMYEATKKKLEHLMSKKVLQVQLYHQSRTPLLSEVESEIKALLKSEMEDDRTEIVFTDCNQKNDVDPNKPLLILCIGASRLGTDAKNAIYELNLNSNMALLIFHHKDVHALPNQASERVLTGQEFKSLGEIIDMAFLSSKGIYECEMNNKSIKNVIAFLRK